MAITQNIYTGNGSTVLFNFTFEYLDTTDVYVEVNDVLTTAYSFANATTIQFNTAPANGLRIRIYRKTDTDNPKATFFSGSAIRAQDLNNNATQSLYSVQEWQDQTVPKYNAVMPDDLDLGTYQIKNMGEPTLAQDAATKNYVDTTTVASAGDSMTGNLAMGSNKVTGLGEPSASQDAATKNYVDTTTVASAGDNMTGNLAMGDNKVTGLGEPTASQDAATKNYVDTTTWNVTSETLDSTEAWVSSDSVIATTGATTNETDTRYDTLVQTATPAGSSWRTGKTWLQNDVNNTLSMWDGSTWKGISSGGTFTTQPTVVYVDNVNGSDTNDGHRIINPMKTIKAAVASASAGWIIKVAPGVYQESLPIDITVDNLSIVGEAQRSCFVHPTVATQEQIMFRCNSGTYIDGFTFVGLKASGARGTNAIDTNATYGLPANQGWVAGFYPGCSIKKSPYINNCSNFADSGIDNSAFDPNNYAGTGGDLSSAPTGGGIIVDGSVPSVSSPLRSFVVNEFTQVCLDGPGLLVCNNGYAQAVSFFGLFCHYHAKALSGGQINMEVGTTNFGRYGLIADGKSSAAIFTATANGAASASATTFAINAPTAGGSWFGDATRPAINMLVQIGADIYPILSSTANGAGWNVVISRPNPSNRIENLGLINNHANGAAVSFFLRSMISTASHTMEYAGSGTNYNALPENGGVAVEGNEVTNLNNGKVWLTSTDQSGKFKVGDTLQVDQQTGFVTIDPSAVATNVVSDLTPELGGDLDVLTRSIYSSLGNVYVNDTLEVNSGSAATPAITFNGDTNTGIYSPGADQVAISTNSTQSLLVDASGNVGIKNSAPSTVVYSGGASLAVGNGAVTSTIRIADNSEIAYNGNLQINNFAASATIFSTSNIERLRITAGGLVGVGTSSPQAQFQTVYTATSPSLAANTGAGIAIGNNASVNLGFGGYSSSPYASWIQSKDHGGGGSAVPLVLNPLGGNVGIGTTSPQSFVTINGGTGAGFTDVLQLSAGAAAANSGPGLSFNINYGDYDYYKTWQTGLIRSAAENTSTYNGYLAFYTNSGANATNISEKVRIDSSGRVGIGTTSPSVRLHVNVDSASETDVARFQASNGADIQFLDIGVDPTGNFVSYDATGSTGGAHVFRRGGGEVMRLDNASRLLVGTSTTSGFQPGAKHIFMDGGGASYSSVSIGNVGGAANTTDLNITAWAGGGNSYATSKLRQNGSDGSLSFHTQATNSVDGAGTTHERLRILSNGGISASLNNDTSTSNALLTLTRGYGVHPGKTSNYYGIYATIASSGGNFDNTAAIFGEASNDYCPGVTGKGGTTVGIGCGVQGWAIGNTDGYGVNYGLYSRLQQVGSGGNGTLVGVGIELPNYAGTASTKSMGIWYKSAYTGSDTQTVLFVQRNNTGIGSITTTVSSTAYNTSSDYRLKENVTLLTGATDRLKQIPVHRFNFISDPDKTVDGFLAHEAQAVVPECVTGTKDEVDADGNPVYQGIDQSKLVPLLTAALQEAIAKIEILETRLTAAGIE